MSPWKTLSSAEGEGDVGVGSAGLDLASRGRDAVVPDDGRAVRVGRGLDELAAGKGVAKGVAKVVPDLGVVEAVGEDGLRRAVVEAVGHARDLEGLAAGDGVLDELLAVLGLGVDAPGVGDAGADGPEVDGGVAVVEDAGATYSSGEGSGQGEAGGGDVEELDHFEGGDGWVVLVVDIRVLLRWCYCNSLL